MELVVHTRPSYFEPGGRVRERGKRGGEKRGRKKEREEEKEELGKRLVTPSIFAIITRKRHLCVSL